MSPTKVYPGCIGEIDVRGLAKRKLKKKKYLFHPLAQKSEKIKGPDLPNTKMKCSNVKHMKLIGCHVASTINSHATHYFNQFVSCATSPLFLAQKGYLAMHLLSQDTVFDLLWTINNREDILDDLFIRSDPEKPASKATLNSLPSFPINVWVCTKNKICPWCQSKCTILEFYLWFLLWGGTKEACTSSRLCTPLSIPEYLEIIPSVAFPCSATAWLGIQSHSVMEISLEVPSFP